MRIVKFEKNSCPKCDVVQGILEGEGISPETIEHVDVENTSDLDFVAQFVQMTLPVVVLLDDDNNLVKRAADIDREALMEIISIFSSK